MKNLCNFYFCYQNKTPLTADLKKSIVWPMPDVLPIKILNRLPTPQYPHQPKFGTAFTPHILQIDLDTSSNAPLQAVIRAQTEGERFTVASIVLHYGQSIFEGMKAFRQKDGSVAIFRPELHAERFMKSAERLAMPLLGKDVFLKALEEYVRIEKDSVPSAPEHALYLRPLMIAKDEIVKVGRSKKYSFYITACVVGSYFASGNAKPARVWVCREFVRAAPGGLGEAKTAANYAASLYPQTLAEKLGCDQVLYLDAIKHDLVDELGGMNFFIVKNGELLTPRLNGAILRGVTRQSILDISSRLGLKAKEGDISFTEMVKGVADGSVTEAFACGTAAVVHSIGEFLVQNKKDDSPQSVRLPSATPVASKLLETLSQIQRGQTEVPSGWLWRI